MPSLDNFRVIALLDIASKIVNDIITNAARLQARTFDYRRHHSSEKGVRSQKRKSP